MSGGENDTIIPAGRPIGERVAQLEAKSSAMRKQDDRFRGDIVKFYERHDEHDRRDAAQSVVVGNLEDDVKSLKATQKLHGRIVFAGYAFIGLGVLLFKMFGREFVARMAGGSP